MSLGLLAGVYKGGLRDVGPAVHSPSTVGALAITNVQFPHIPDRAVVSYTLSIPQNDAFKYFCAYVTLFPGACLPSAVERQGLRPPWVGTRRRDAFELPSR